MASNSQTLNQIIAIFRDLAMRNEMIADFGFQQEAEISTDRNILFPYLHCEPTGSQLIQNNNNIFQRMVYSFDISVMDRLDKDEGNWEEALSDCHYILSTIISEISKHPYYKELQLRISGDINLTPAMEVRNEYTNGWMASIDIEVPFRYTPCNSPIIPISGFTISYNKSITEYRLIGNTGPQGPIGPTGANGAQGVQGATGPQGFQGDRGFQGFQGATGPQGFQGTTGLTGATGPQGFQGVQGATGPQGFQGSIGLAGATGPQGFQGVQGATGPQGFQGTTGPQGFQGSPANPGLSGFGDINLNNNAVAITATSSNTWYIITNFNGNSGDFNGVTFSGTSTLTAQMASTYQLAFSVSFICSKANQDLRFGIFKNGSLLTDHQVQISVGNSNAVTPAAITGIVSLAIGDTIDVRVNNTTSTGALITCQYGNLGIAAVTGAQGPQGFQGATGPQGFQGTTGLTGATGPQGFQGVQGATGPQGSAGTSLGATISIYDYNNLDHFIWGFITTPAVNNSSNGWYFTGNVPAQIDMRASNITGLPGPGVIQLQVAAATSSYILMSRGGANSGQAVNFNINSGTLSITWGFLSPSAALNTNGTTEFGIGLFNNPTTPTDPTSATNSILFTISASGSNNRMVAKSTSSSGIVTSISDTQTMANSTAFNARIDCGTTSVSFFLNGRNIGTINTNLPSIFFTRPSLYGFRSVAGVGTQLLTSDFWYEQQTIINRTTL